MVSKPISSTSRCKRWRDLASPAYSIFDVRAIRLFSCEARTGFDSNVEAVSQWMLCEVAQESDTADSRFLCCAFPSQTQRQCWSSCPVLWPTASRLSAAHEHSRVRVLHQMLPREHLHLHPQSVCAGGTSASPHLSSRHSPSYSRTCADY